MSALEPLNPDKALISEVAMEIGKDLIAYIECQYPDVFAAMNGGCRLSIRNHVHNDIMWAIKNRTEADYRKWLADRKINRRSLMRMVRQGRRQARDTR